MDRIDIENLDTGKIVGADVMSRSDKKIRVVIDGMSDPINLTRLDTRSPFAANMFGMQLRTKG